MSGNTLVRLSMQLPRGWEETLLWQLAEDGFGTGLLEHRFMAGHLDDEPVGSAGHPEVVFVLTLDAVNEILKRMGELADLYGWQPGEWRHQQDVISMTDWESAWRKRWKPFRCGSFVIHADFHDLSAIALRSEDQPLQLPTGSAFGTGGHPSTRIALRCLQRWWREKPFHKMLDVGMGTGILSVAAAALGAKYAVGMDPDPPSPAQARAMAELNGVASACHFWEGTLDSTNGKWEVIIANLQSGLLQHYSSMLAERLENDGRLFVGGFMDKNQERTLASLTGAGLMLKKLHSHGRWRAAELCKSDETRP